MLKDLIQNSLLEEYRTKDQICDSIVSIGFGHDRESITRTLRKLAEEGLIEQAEGRPLRYRKKVRQYELI